MAEAAWPGGSLAFDGMALLPAEAAGAPSLSGRARFETSSLPETLAWIGSEAPLAPLAGAVAPRTVPARILVLLVSLALQALWLWVCYGPVQAYWTVP